MEICTKNIHLLVIAKACPPTGLLNSLMRFHARSSVQMMDPDMKIYTTTYMEIYINTYLTTHRKTYMKTYANTCMKTYTKTYKQIAKKLV